MTDDTTPQAEPRHPLPWRCGTHPDVVTGEPIGFLDDASGNPIDFDDPHVCAAVAWAMNAAAEPELPPDLVAAAAPLVSPPLWPAPPPTDEDVRQMVDDEMAFEAERPPDPVNTEGTEAAAPGIAPGHEMVTLADGVQTLRKTEPTSCPTRNEAHEAMYDITRLYDKGWGSTDAVEPGLAVINCLFAELERLRGIVDACHEQMRSAGYMATHASLAHKMGIVARRDAARRDELPKANRAAKLLVADVDDLGPEFEARLSQALARFLTDMAPIVETAYDRPRAYAKAAGAMLGPALLPMTEGCENYLDLKFVQGPNDEPGGGFIVYKPGRSPADRIDEAVAALDRSRDHAKRQAAEKNRKLKGQRQTIKELSATVAAAQEALDEAGVPREVKACDDPACERMKKLSLPARVAKGFDL
jgi:hypothetical protein